MEDLILSKLEVIERNSLLAAKNVLTIDDVAVLTGMSKSHLYKLTCTRQIPFYRPNGKIVYTPKSAPQYINRNGIYCYFIVTDGTPGPLRFVVQYYADDWLFFKRVQFSIDGNAFEFIPLKTETDNGDGGKIWEWFDEALTSSDQDLIYALSNAHSAKMKFLGQQYFDIKNISQSQITDIKRALDLYHAMGGTY